MPVAADLFVAVLALIGVVIIIAALLSGLIERSGVPQVGVLLALGAVLGPYGLGLINPTLDSPVLRAVSFLSLTLVLFTDALSLDVKEIRRHLRLTLLVLGPGTILSAVVVTLLAVYLLGLSWPAAAVLGAALASTDPVLLRGLLRRPDLPTPARLALRLESGLNDAVLLPPVLIAMALQGTRSLEGPADWSRMGMELFLLGPAAGIIIGLLGVATLDLVRRRLGVRRDYESLYSLGIAFTAFAAAESFHGSGFLAAFAAGMTISTFDVELCDCFQEYGETTAEMTLLFTFVLLGSSLIWTGLEGIGLVEILFAVAVLLVRPVVFLISLGFTKLDRRSLFLISWFGPRGLSSLLLVLLTVFAGMPGSDRLFELCSLVVLLSVVVHGGSLMFFPKQGTGEPTVEQPPLPQIPQMSQIPQATPAERSSLPLPILNPRLEPDVNYGPAQVLNQTPDHVPEKIGLAEMLRLRESGHEVILLDVRTARSRNVSGQIAPGTVRVDPERAVYEAERLQLPREAWLIAFCA